MVAIGVGVVVAIGVVVVVAVAVAIGVVVVVWLAVGERVRVVGCVRRVVAIGVALRLAQCDTINTLASA